MDRVVSLIESRLPASEAQLVAALVRAGVPTPEPSLAAIAKALKAAGERVPFRTVDLHGTRIAVEPHHATLAKTTYGLASRGVSAWGATSVANVAGRLQVMTSRKVSPQFVRRLVAAVEGFAWLDESDGWFWFRGLKNRLVDDLETIFSVVRRVSLARLWCALRRVHAWATAPLPPHVLARVSAALAGVQLVGDVVVVSERHARRERRLSVSEARMVRMLKQAGRPLPADEIRRILSPSLPASSLRWLLHSSALIEPRADGCFGLLGAAL